MILFLEHTDVNRLLMGGNMMRQWLLPLDPEMPLHKNAAFSEYQVEFRRSGEAGGATEEALVQTGCEPENLQFAPQAPSRPELPLAVVAAEGAEPIPLNLEDATLWVIKRALEQTDGNVAAAARLLGTSRTRVYRFLDRGEKGLVEL